MPHAESAVDGNHGTGDVGAVGPGEEVDDACDLVDVGLDPS